LSKVAIVFFSGTGTTKKLAESVQEGVAETDAQCLMCELSGEEITAGRWANDSLANSLDDCDAIIFGTPTYMGSLSAQLKAFFDAMVPRWYTQAWNGKLAAGFTASSLAAGDKLNCLQDISSFAMQMGMVWVGTGASFSDQLNPNGFYLGVGATASTPEQIQDIDANTARFLGRRVAEYAARLAE